MQPGELTRVVYEALSTFYKRRLQKLSELNLKDTLKKKNPYLFRAVGVRDANEIVEGLLRAYMSSSEETIFGDAFFEPVVKAACRGVAASGSGIDVVIEKDDSYTVISVKSGPNWGNSSQMAKLQTDFNTAYAVFTNKKLSKQFRAVLAHCYGRARGEPTAKRTYSVRSGQAFWAEITGDPDFYLKLIRAMDDYPIDHRREYDREYAKAVNRFTKEFLNEFSMPDGSIDWEKLVRFNSGVDGGKD